MWTDLGDDELQARLEQREIHPLVADNLVRHRDDDEYAEIIGGLLE